MKPRGAAGLAAIAGALIPAVCMLDGYVHPFLAGDWLAWIWPSSIQLMVLDNRPPWPVAVVVVAISVAFNMILYAAIAWAMAFVYVRWRARTLRRLS